MSWRPEVPQDKRRFVMPTYYGYMADLLISSHWAGKDRKIQEEHEALYRIVLQIDLELWTFEPENDDENVLWARVRNAAREYRKWRDSQGVVDFITQKDSKDYLVESSIYLTGIGEINLAPDKAAYFEITGLPPIRYIDGLVSLDELDADTREWKAHVIRDTAGIRARIYECHNPDLDYLSCIFNCKNKGNCPYLVGPVYARNLNRLDSGTWRTLRNMTHRRLCIEEAKMIRPLFDLIGRHVSSDQLQELGDLFGGRMDEGNDQDFRETSE